MGKRLIQQARGKGSPTYKSPSFRYAGDVKLKNKVTSAKINDIITSQGHSAPLLEVEYSDNTKGLLIAPEGIKAGEEIQIGSGEAKIGNILPLKDIPEGTTVYNIEKQPGDGGQFVRSTGSSARVLAKTDKYVRVMLPSKSTKRFHPNCRAMIGTVAGGGRTEKPFYKAGRRYHKMRAKNKLYPIIGGSSQNAVDHPFGNKRSSRKSHAKPAPKNAPPGRKVGMIRPKRTGRKRGKRVRKGEE